MEHVKIIAMILVLFTLVSGGCKKKGAPSQQTIDLPAATEAEPLEIGGVRYEMVAIPGGSFPMGSNHGFERERPVHTVRVSPFLIGRTEVTQDLWQAVMGDNPSKFQGNGFRPVENVSWDKCQDFIQRLNERTGGSYRLPTEAEWEYACRAGTTGDHYGKVAAIGWYLENSGKSTHPVGEMEPNEFGLYDMSGNVWEWCEDGFDENYYAASPSVDPTGSDNGGLRVSRGGAWNCSSWVLRTSYRFSCIPTSRDKTRGLRIAADPQN